MNLRSHCGKRPERVSGNNEVRTMRLTFTFLGRPASSDFLLFCTLARFLSSFFFSALLLLICYVLFFLCAFFSGRCCDCSE